MENRVDNPRSDKPRSLAATTKEAVASDAAILGRVFGISCILVVIIPAILSGVIGSIATRFMPSEFADVAKRIIRFSAPVILIFSYTNIQQISITLGAVPMLMRAKDVLEDVTAKNSTEQKKLQTGIDYIVRGRKTLLRVQVFIAVAIIYAAISLKFGAKSLAGDLKGMVGKFKGGAMSGGF